MGRAKLTNEEVLTKGLQKAKAIIVQHLVNQLRPICLQLLEAADNHRTFLGWTGNTQTSYMCLIYVDGGLIAEVTKAGVKIQPVSRILVNQQRYTKHPIPVHLTETDDDGVVTSERWVIKVEKNRFGWIAHPYEGEARSVFGMVDVNNMTGEETSRKNLFKYNFEGRKPYIAIVVTTGTEYSEFLEEYRHLDVLSGAYYDAPDILKKGLSVPLENGK